MRFDSIVLLKRLLKLGKTVGDLNQVRARHDVIISQGVFLIVGSGPTERCELSDVDTIKCSMRDPYLTVYTVFAHMCPIYLTPFKHLILKTFNSLFQVLWFLTKCLMWSVHV